MSDKPELKTPQQIALRYRYERILGEGSNGKTYLATDRKTGKQVAIKALKLVQSDYFKSFELFKREAETLSSIHVPGVPQFYQSILANTLDDESYIIQEYINAPSIQSYLNAGRVFSESETLTIMQKVAAILHIIIGWDCMRSLKATKYHQPKVIRLQVVFIIKCDLNHVL